MRFKSIFPFAGALLILGFLVSACIPKASRDPAVNLVTTPVATSTSVGETSKPTPIPPQRLRVTNQSALTIQKLHVRFPNESVDFGDVPAGTTSDYQVFSRGVYRYAAYEVVVDGQKYEQPVMDWGGENPMNGDAFTYLLDVDPAKWKTQGQVILLVEVKEEPSLQSAAPTSPPNAYPPGALFVTVKAGETEVKVRSGPGTTFPVVGSLHAGDKMAVFGKTAAQDWVLIEFPGGANGKAWIYAGLVNLPSGELPVVDPVSGEVVPAAGPTPMSATGRPAAIKAIQSYLKKDDLSYQYLGIDVNLNSPTLQKIDRYSVDEVMYSVDIETNLIVGIDASRAATISGDPLTQAELERKAVQLIAALAPGVDLKTFTPQHGNKGDNYFFRWEGGKDEGFLQVGYTQTGGLLNYNNALSNLGPTTSVVLSTSIPNPSGLTIEENQIVGEPVADDPLKFTPLHGTQQEVMARHAEAMQPPYLIRQDFISNGEVITAMGDDRLKVLESSQSGSSGERPKLQLERDGNIIFKTEEWYHPPTSNILIGLWADGSHWTLEINGAPAILQDPCGQIYRDGVNLNQKFGYEETFGFQLLDGKPFYFYQKDEHIHLSYDGQDLPLVYDQVPHYGCCSNAELNPRSGPNWLTFLGQRNGTWYYVQIGRYD